LRIFRLRLSQKTNYPTSNGFSGVARGHTGYFNFWNGLTIALFLVGLFAALFAGILPSNFGQVYAQSASVSACTNGADFTTIQAAIDAVDSGGTVTICGETFVENLSINKSVTLRGAGATNTLIRAYDNTTVTISPDLDVTIEELSIVASVTEFEGINHNGVANSGTLVMRQVYIYSTPQGLLNQGGDVTIIDSVVRDNGRNSYRAKVAGIQNSSGTLRVINSEVSDNGAFRHSTSLGSGTGIYNSGVAFIVGGTIQGNKGGRTGGIFNDGEMTIEDSSVRDNRALKGVGGIENRGVLTITRTTIAENIGYNDEWNSGSCMLSGGIANFNVLEITDSLIQGNRKPSDRVGGGCLGGGIYNSGRLNSGRLSRIKNTTITQNNLDCHNNCASGGGGGGIANVDNAILELENVTIYENQGGGLYTESGASITLVNSIVAANEGDNCRKVNGEIASLGHNTDTDNSCELNATGDQPGVVLQLGPLQDNGGSTFTHALLPNSPAIDAGSNANCPATDQRGVSRPQGTACDIGAFELETNNQSILGNVDCDDDLDATDALFTLQYVAELRTDHGSCPLADSDTQLHAAAGDMNDDGQTDAVDALIMLQCIAGLSNDYCDM